MSDTSLGVPRSLGRALNLTAATGSAVVNRLLQPHGLGLAQWAVLVSIWKNGPLGVKEIASLTGNAPPAASRIVDRMVHGGLLERQTDPEDRRAVVVDVTEKGAELRHLEDTFLDVNRVLSAGLSEGEVAQLFDLLGRVNAAGRDWLGQS